MIAPFSKPFSAPFVKPFGPEADFSPLDIPDLLAWYDATDESTINEDSGLVDFWFDKSGNGNTVATLSFARPLTGTKTINGLNTIAFDGTNDFLSADPFTPNPNFTVALVFEVVSVNGSAESVVSFNDNLAGNEDFQIDANSSLFLANFDSNNLGNVTGVQNGDIIGSPTAYMYRLATQDPINSSVRLFDANFNIATNLNAYNGNLSNDQEFIIGANRNLAQFLEVNVGEIVIVNKAVTDQERKKLFTYFTAKWGT